MPNRRDLIGILIVIATSIIFGLYPAATRGSYADGANAVFIILFTTFFRAATLTCFCLVTNRKLFRTKNDTITGMQNGVFQTLSIIGILGAMAFMPGPMVITLMFSSTFLLYLFLVFKGEEQVRTATLLSIGAAFCGLGLVTGAQNQFSDLSLMGLALAMMAALATATRMYRYGNLLKTKDAAIVGAEAFIFTLLFCVFLTFYELPITPTTQQGWLWASLAAASFSIGNFGMFYGIALLGSFKFSFFIKLEPIFGAVFSVLLINEVLSLTQYIGMAIVVGSLCFYQYLQKRTA